MQKAIGPTFQAGLLLPDDIDIRTREDSQCVSTYQAWHLLKLPLVVAVIFVLCLAEDWKECPVYGSFWWRCRRMSLYIRRENIS